MMWEEIIHFKNFTNGLYSWRTKKKMTQQHYSPLVAIFGLLDDEGPFVPFCLACLALTRILSRFFLLILSGMGSVEMGFLLGIILAIFFASLFEVFFICNMYSGTSHPEFRIT